MGSNALGVALSRAQVLGQVPNAAEAFPKDYPSPPQPWNPGQGSVLIQHSSLNCHLSGRFASRSTLPPLPPPRDLGGWSSQAPRKPSSGNPRPRKSPSMSTLAPCALRSGWSQ